MEGSFHPESVVSEEFAVVGCKAEERIFCEFLCMEAVEDASYLLVDDFDHIVIVSFSELCVVFWDFPEICPASLSGDGEFSSDGGFFKLSGMCL